MKELFVPYELAVKLKEKGFKQDCLNAYDDNDHQLIVIDHWAFSSKIFTSDAIAAPLWQQVIDWLREEKAVQVLVQAGFSYGEYEYYVVNFRTGASENETKDAYYSALQSGIEKALELI